MTSQYSENRSSRIRVFEAIKAIEEQELPVTGDTIARHTGLKMVTVNDCIKELKERDEIWSPERGVYRVKLQEEPSQTVFFISLPCGGVKIEKGEHLMEFTSHEWRKQVAPFASGFAVQTVAIEYTHRTMQLAEQIARLERKISELKNRHTTDSRQLEIEV